MTDEHVDTEIRENKRLEMALKPMTPPQDIRPEVMAFAHEMENRLRANDHKGGWQDCDFAYLIQRIREETDELADTMRDVGGLFDYAEIRREAADVGNFAMMVADVFGLLASPKDDERPADGDDTDHALEALTRERDELRTEVEQLKGERDAEAARYDAVMDTLKAIRQDQDRALTQNERLRAALREHHPLTAEWLLCPICERSA